MRSGLVSQRVEEQSLRQVRDRLRTVKARVGGDPERHCNQSVVIYAISKIPCSELKEGWRDVYKEALLKNESNSFKGYEKPRCV